MGALLSVLMVYAGMVAEREAGVDKFVAFGHGIAMDSAQGVFLLAAAFALR